MPEGRRVFATLSVLENLELGSYRTAARGERGPAPGPCAPSSWCSESDGGRWRGRSRAASSRCWRWGAASWRRPTGCCSTSPRRGSPPIVETIDRIRRERRLTILLVEQRVVEALELCDRGYVLETGRVALAGSHEVLLGDPRVQRVYLGV